MRIFVAMFMQDRLRAILFAAFFGAFSLVILPMIFFSGAVVGLVALRKGVSEGITVAFWAGILVVLGIFLLPEKPGFDIPLIVCMYPLILVSAHYLGKTEAHGVVVLVAGCCAALFVVAMHASTADVAVFWREWLEHAVKNVEGANVEGFKREDTLGLFNGFVAMFAGAAIILTVLLARWWQAIVYNPGGFQKEFHELRLPRMQLPIVVAILVVLGNFERSIMIDLFMVALMIFLFQGVAVLHALAGKSGVYSKFLILPIYIGLLLMPQYAVLGLGMLGALDTQVDFRKRAPKTGR